MFSIAKDEFLLKYKISNDELIRSGLNWDTLAEIGTDHFYNIENRKGIAEFFVKIIQGCKEVHSVRWRVKDPEHLIEKIIRKNLPKDGETVQEKYKTINKENYHEIVTDLIGIRAIHLFKDEYKPIDNFLKSVWEPQELPVIYIRNGDAEYNEDGFSIKIHPAGYRSIHYVFQSQLSRKPTFIEVQVRTIFEEGWSEIDHKVRYPNFSEDQNIIYFLNIFNRMSGSADEMGSFVKTLDTELKKHAEMLSKANSESQKLRAENEERMASIEKLISELESYKGENKTKNKTISELRSQVEKLRETATKQQPLIDFAGSTLSSRNNRDSYASIISDAGLDRVASRNSLIYDRDSSISSYWLKSSNSSNNSDDKKR